MLSIDPGSHIAVMILAIGLVLALACYLITNISPGGLIVPGWLALSLVSGVGAIALTGVTVAATYVAALLLRRHAILYGKRLFVSVVLLAVFIQLTAFLTLQGRYPGLFPGDTLGFVIPGLLAYQLQRQKIAPTLIATAATTLVTAAFIVVGFAV